MWQNRRLVDVSVSECVRVSVCPAADKFMCKQSKDFKYNMTTLRVHRCYYSIGLCNSYHVTFTGLELEVVCFVEHGIFLHE